MKFRARSIRSQLILGLVALEALSMLLFAVVLVRKQRREMRNRAELRLQHQASSLAMQVSATVKTGHPDSISGFVSMLADAPSVESVRITDPQGRVLALSGSSANSLLPGERMQLGHIPLNEPVTFTLGEGRLEGVKAILGSSGLYGYAWVATDREWDREQVESLLHTTEIFGVIWLCASALLAWWMANSISRPLAVLHRGTQALMRSPEAEAPFPLPVEVENEIGDLVEAFNRMVASIAEQRAGLSDTLSLLDSMLANAPIGLAFFDRRHRFVRVNRIFAALSGVSLSRHLGRTLPEVLPPIVAHELETAIASVFENDQAVQDREVSGADEATGAWTWITSAYPIHTQPQQVRWVGLIVMDVSDRKRGEEALRKTEKLAATGRLAASIAHEINNPLEAITNLLYLLHNHDQLPEAVRNYVEMAEHEVRRISEITQQTLRFYRQSTLPSRANLAELVDSVLRLHQTRLKNLGIAVERRYDAEMDLYCFAGEVRQVFANLIGNAIDAMPLGGRLLVRARRSCDWQDSQRIGVRFLVADTGSGMKPNVREHIFEPFFTTKEKTGTGLGLWVSHEIVVKHKGFVRVRSRWSGAKTGTVFELFFPDYADLSVEEPEAQAEISAAV
ncbi:MAG TPA: ATP-binding protein [Acidobacteriaceae bacterium]|nr:ATP-binding protein [Acidobacteriaceae bacterium]